MGLKQFFSDMYANYRKSRVAPTVIVPPQSGTPEKKAQPVDKLAGNKNGNTPPGLEDRTFSGLMPLSR